MGISRAALPMARLCLPGRDHRDKPGDDGCDCGTGPPDSLVKQPIRLAHTSQANAPLPGFFDQAPGAACSFWCRRPTEGARDAGPGPDGPTGLVGLAATRHAEAELCLPLALCRTLGGARRKSAGFPGVPRAVFIGLLRKEPRKSSVFTRRKTRPSDEDQTRFARL